MFEEILSRVAAGLSRHKIPYMIIGGQAVLLYGEPRLTRDIDLTLGVNADQLDEVLAVVKEASLKPLPKDIDHFVRQTMVLPAADDISGIRVDFIFSFTPYESQAIGRAKKVSIKDQEVSFASPEDVIIHKIFAGRARDMEDARTILLKNPGLDISYIRNWLKEFDEASDEKKFVRAFDEILKGIEN
jgi:predicted nucleotidyltransferase